METTIKGSKVAAVDTRKRITFVIPTMPRGSGTAYLSSTLLSLSRGISRLPFTHLFHVSVFNTRPGQSHAAFDEELRKRGSEPHFRFVTLPDLGFAEAHSGPVKGKWRTTTLSDMRHSVDLAGVLAEVIRGPECAAAGSLVVLTEDDALLCHHALVHLLYALGKVEDRSQAGAGWTVLRLGAGLIGVVVRCEDLGAVSRYLLAHLRDGPADWVLAEFWTKADAEGQGYFGQERKYHAYRYNLFHHIGRTSSFKGRLEEIDSNNHTRRYHSCFDQLSTTLHPLEAFHGQCHHTDLSPCDLLTGGRNDDLGAIDVDEQVLVDDPHPWLISPHFPRTDGPIVASELCDLVVVQSLPGQSCDQACEDDEAACVQSWLSSINSCEYITRLKCERGCRLGFRQHAAYPNKAEDEVCETSPIRAILTCSGKEKGMARFCPCKRK
jgi:hypothetical protein